MNRITCTCLDNILFYQPYFTSFSISSQIKKKMPAIRHSFCNYWSLKNGGNDNTMCLSCNYDYEINCLFRYMVVTA